MRPAGTGNHETKIAGRGRRAGHHANVRDDIAQVGTSCWLVIAFCCLLSVLVRYTALQIDLRFGKEAAQGTAMGPPTALALFLLVISFRRGLQAPESSDAMRCFERERNCQPLKQLINIRAAFDRTRCHLNLVGRTFDCL